MIQHSEVSDMEVKKAIRSMLIVLGGNAKLKIYGKLNCKSGKRMKKQNRVFFTSVKEAIEQGFRPCGHCMRMEYKKWKDDFI
jgi:methylphosphotriester-DNA--protein-cysteine methyltransferase